MGLGTINTSANIKMPTVVLDSNSVISVLEFCWLEDICNFSCTNRYWKNALSETSLAFLWCRLFYFYIFQFTTTEFASRRSKTEYYYTSSCRTLLNWRDKLKDICIFLNSDDKVSMEQSSIGKISRRAQSSAAQISITSSKNVGSSSMSTVSDKLIICFGGATENYLYLDSCDVISLTHKRIFRHVLPDPIPSKRWLHTVTSIGNKVFVLGGYGFLSDYDFNQQSFVLTVEAVDNRRGDGYQIHTSPLLWEGELTELPVRRAGHTVTIYSVDTSTTKFVLFGGQNSSLQYLNDVYTAVVHTEDSTPSHSHHQGSDGRVTWQLVQCSGSYPRPRHCHSAVYMEENRTILIFGGWAGRHEFLNDVYLLDVTDFSWTRMNTEGVPPCPRCQMNVFLVPPVRASSGFATSLGYLLVYGGACHYHVCVAFFLYYSQIWHHM